MAFRIAGLDPALFHDWFSLSDAELATRRARRHTADPAVEYLHVHNAKPGCFACRVDRADQAGVQEVSADTSADASR